MAVSRHGRRSRLRWHGAGRAAQRPAHSRRARWSKSGCPTGTRSGSVYTINMSLGGMRLSFGARAPLGTAIDIILTLPNGERLHLPGKVAHLGPDAAATSASVSTMLPPKTLEADSPLRHRARGRSHADARETAHDAFRPACSSEEDVTPCGDRAALRSPCRPPAPGRRARADPGRVRPRDAAAASAQTIDRPRSRPAPCSPPRSPLTAPPTSRSIDHPAQARRAARARGDGRRRLRPRRSARAARRRALPDDSSGGRSRRRDAGRRMARSGSAGRSRSRCSTWPAARSAPPRRRRRASARRRRLLAGKIVFTIDAAPGRQHAGDRRAARHPKLDLAAAADHRPQSRTASRRGWRRPPTSRCAPWRCGPSSSRRRAPGGRGDRCRRRRLAPRYGAARRRQAGPAARARSGRAGGALPDAAPGRRRRRAPARASGAERCGQLRNPHSWRAFPGWSSVIPRPGAHGPDAVVEDSLPLADFDATWTAEPGGLPRWTVTDGDTRGARLGWVAQPLSDGNALATLTLYPRLETSGRVARRAIASEPLMEHGLALGLAFADVAGVKTAIDDERPRWIRDPLGNPRRSAAAPRNDRASLPAARARRLLPCGRMQKLAWVTVCGLLVACGSVESGPTGVGGDGGGGGSLVTGAGGDAGGAPGRGGSTGVAGTTGVAGSTGVAGQGSAGTTGVAGQGPGGAGPGGTRGSAGRGGNSGGAGHAGGGSGVAGTGPGGSTGRGGSGPGGAGPGGSTGRGGSGPGGAGPGGSTGRGGTGGADTTCSDSETRIRQGDAGRADVRCGKERPVHQRQLDWPAAARPTSRTSRLDMTRTLQTAASKSSARDRLPSSRHRGLRADGQRRLLRHAARPATDGADSEPVPSASCRRLGLVARLRLSLDLALSSVFGLSSAFSLASVFDASSDFGAAFGGPAQLADAGAAERLLRAGRIGRHHLRAGGVGAALLAILLVVVLLLLGNRARLAPLAARTAVVGDRAHSPCRSCSRGRRRARALPPAALLGLGGSRHADRDARDHRDSDARKRRAESNVLHRSRRHDG